MLFILSAMGREIFLSYLTPPPSTLASRNDFFRRSFVVSESNEGPKFICPPEDFSDFITPTSVFFFIL